MARAAVYDAPPAPQLRGLVDSDRRRGSSLGLVSKGNRGNQDRSVLRPIAVGLAFVSFVAGAGCVVRYGTDAFVLGGEDAGGDAPGLDASAPSLPDAAPTLAKVPARPTTEDGTASNLSLTFAASWAGFYPSADAGVTLAKDDVGYDLDGVASCPGPGSCVSASDVDPTATCDGPLGRDNAFLRMLERLNAASLDNGVANSFQRGRAGLVIRVGRYNGGRNDAEVEVQIFPSLGTQASLTDGGAPDPDGGATLPRFDGTDFWSVSADSLRNAPPAGTPCDQGQCDPVGRDTTAYVSDGVLVSKLDVPLLLADLGPQAFLDIRGGYAIARLERGPNGQFTLENGQVIGRLEPESTLKALARADDPFSSNGARICESLLSLNIVRQVACQFLDIAVSPQQDNQGAKCTGTSVALLFRAGPARLGTVQAAKPDDVRCDPSGVYSCEAP